MRAKEIREGTLMGIFAHGDDGIAEDAKIRAGTLAFDGVGGIGVPKIKMCEGHGGEMAAG